MICHPKKTIRFIIVFLLCLSIAPLNGVAGIYLETEIVSGTITAVKDDAVELDGKSELYYPAKKSLIMPLKTGSTVTLRYYFDNSDEPTRKYVEFAPGINSLKHKTHPVKKKMDNK